MKKTIAILLSCLMLLSLFAGCGNDTGAAEKPEDRVLKMRTLAALVSTDWANSTLTYDMVVLWVHVFESLYGMDEAHGGYYNQLAKDVQVSEDGLTYTVTLVDATFQNGDPLTAEDVVYSYEIAKENSRFNYVTSFINKIEAKDEKTVLFHLDYPYSAISHTFWTVKIMSKREHQEIINSGKQFGTEPHTCGTGPYILKSFDQNGHVLEAYENYWGGAPEIKHVQYQVISDDAAAVIAFENGELDYFTDVPTTDWESVKEVAGDRATMVKGNDVAVMFLNYLSPTNNNILGNEKVREAIFWCVNKQDCVQAATSGYGSVAYEYVACDDHGAIETCASTSHDDPIYYVDGILHYAVDNIPSAFSCTASQTLSAATLPHALAIANKGVEKALLEDVHLRRGLTTYKGMLTLLETAQKHNMEFVDPKDAILKAGC